MQIAILSDIHGNKDALDAVLEDIPKNVGNYWCLGDTIGYGPQPRECLEFVKNKCQYVLKGNHEAMVLEPENDGRYRPDVRDETSWTRKTLDQEEIDYIKFLPEIEPGEITLVHGGFPHYVWSYTENSIDALRALGHVPDAEFIFLGHTHKPVIWELGADEKMSFHTAKGVFHMHSQCRYVFNVGSVGQPRDGINTASYAILDDDEQTVEFRRVKYDFKETLRKIREAGLPETCGTRLEKGK